MTERRERREYSETFKQQAVQLFNSGKPREESIETTTRNVMNQPSRTYLTDSLMVRSD